MLNANMIKFVILSLSVILIFAVRNTATLNCQIFSSQLRSVTAVMCANIAGTSATILNTCTNCFSAAAVANQNQPSLSQTSICANTYLRGTNYAPCATIIANDAVAFNGRVTTGCVGGYCNFVRCVRRANSNILIATCFSQASVGNSQGSDTARVRLYQNITSCILARARCNPVNPITGLTQNNRFIVTTTVNGRPRTVATQLHNTLQITPNGDLQIVALPGTTTVGASFCSAGVSLAQSGWMNVSCR